MRTLEEIKDVLELKRRLNEAAIDYSHLLFCPVVPMLGIERAYVIEEVAGIKVARLISPPND